MMVIASRRKFFGHVLSIAAAVTAWQTRPSGSLPRMEVFKDPSCGCCSTWVEHMRAAGFSGPVTDTDMGPVRLKHGISARLASCHTALIGNFIIEGHVPASDVKKLLSEKPKNVKGLTIPGMPASAPGMDLTPFQPYTVLAFDHKGQTSIYARHDRPGDL